MEGSFFDNDKFITIVQSEPAIWNKQLAGYSLKNEREAAWRNVVRGMYEEKSWDDDEKIRKAVDVLQTKWKNLRNSFTREVSRRTKQRTGSKKDWKTYVYYEQMSFLLPFVTKANTTDNFGDNKDEENSLEEHDGDDMDDHEEEHMDEVIDDAESVERSEAQKRKSNSRETTRSGRKCTKQSEDADLARVLRKSLEWKQEKEEKESSDEDRLFLLSLLSDFKKVPPSQKGHVKIAMLNALLNSQQPLNPTHQQINHYPHSSSYSYGASFDSSSHPPSPYSHPPSPYSHPPSPYSHPPSPYSHPPSPYSHPPSPFTASRSSSSTSTHFNRTPSPFSPPPSPFNASPFSSNRPLSLTCSTHTNTAPNNPSPLSTLTNYYNNFDCTMNDTNNNS